jgi:3-oxoacyl-[acyl-carrier-protein] synthase-3
MLFGDGASALIVSGDTSSNSLEVIDIALATDGGYVDDLGVRGPGTEFGTAASGNENSKPRMVGQSVILNASRKIMAACQDVLKRNSLQVADIRWLVPHQANANLLAQIARGLHFPVENGGLISVLEDLGNTSSASMGIALDSLRRSARIGPGDYLLLPAFGAGFSWGAGLCRATS